MSEYSRNSGGSSPRSSRPWSVVTWVTPRRRRAMGRCSWATWKWITSNSIGSPGHPFHHQHVGREMVAARAVEPQGAGPDRHQPAGRPRIGGREQGHLVAEPHELLGQVRDDALGAAVQLRRHALEERGNLRNSHKLVSCGTPFIRLPGRLRCNAGASDCEGLCPAPCPTGGCARGGAYRGARGPRRRGSSRGAEPRAARSGGRSAPPRRSSRCRCRGGGPSPLGRCP